MLASIAAQGLAAARPRASQTVSLGSTSIILTLDVSRSMCSTDVTPNRITAAQGAAKAFVAEQPKGTRIGLVAFAGFAQELVAPTTDKGSLVRAIDSLTTGRGTVIGAATLKALDAIAEVNPDVAPLGATPTTPRTTAPSTPSRTANKDYIPDIVVLLTDGANS